MKSKRNINLDIIKIIATVQVICLHNSSNAFIIDKNHWLQNNNVIINQLLYYSGTIAVPLFFMVNGYLILNRGTIDRYYISKKIISILNVVVFWNLIVFVANLFKGNIKNPIKLVIGSLIQRGYLYQFWFMGSLIIISLLAIFLNRMLKNHEEKYLILLISLFVISTIVDIYSRFVLVYPMQSYVIQTFRLWTWLFYYMLGGLIGKKKKNIQNFSYLNNGILLSIFTVIVIFLEPMMAVQIKIPYAEYNYDNILIIVWSTWFFCYLLNKPLKISNKFNNLIISLSSVSMGVYIIHPTIIKVLGKLFNTSLPLNNIISLLLTIFVSFATAYVISKIPYVNRSIRM
ncbi:acyltransferase [Streptococcaceae bacterium ESL0729]|nr:acyltransferase [Streptococcaceae bacterium ESL0729]